MSIVRNRGIITPHSNNIDSFKYLILIALHHSNIANNPQRISKLIPYEKSYIFTHTSPTQFEINNPNILLNKYDENVNKIYTSKNYPPHIVNILQINNRYMSIKNLNKFLNHENSYKNINPIKFKEYMLNRIIID